MSLFQRIKSWLGMSEPPAPPAMSAPKPVVPVAPPAPVAPTAVAEPADIPAKSAPVSPEIKALLAKGRAELKAENFVAAKEAFDAILEIDPENEAGLKLSGLSAARIKREQALAQKAAAAAAKG